MRASEPPNIGPTPPVRVAPARDLPDLTSASTTLRRASAPAVGAVAVAGAAVRTACSVAVSTGRSVTVGTDAGAAAIGAAVGAGVGAGPSAMVAAAVGAGVETAGAAAGCARNQRVTPKKTRRPTATISAASPHRGPPTQSADRHQDLL